MHDEMLLNKTHKKNKVQIFKQFMYVQNTHGISDLIDDDECECLCNSDTVNPKNVPN